MLQIIIPSVEYWDEIKQSIYHHQGTNDSIRTFSNLDSKVGGETQDRFSL